MRVMYETGADFTNSFRKLAQLRLSGKSHIDCDIKEYLSIILEDCSSINEMKDFFKPKFPKEYI